MPSLRTKSISTKVTDEEYAQMEALAGGQTISEWARDVLLLKASQPNAGEQIVLAEVLALRMILLNAFYKLSQKEVFSDDEMRELIDAADEEKFQRAKQRLAEATAGGRI